VNKLISTLFVVILVGLALAAVSPTLTKLISSAIWLVAVIGIVACVIRVVWAASRRW
jgi:hypothetical protein